MVYDCSDELCYSCEGSDLDISDRSSVIELDSGFVQKERHPGLSKPCRLCLADFFLSRWLAPDCLFLAPANLLQLSCPSHL